MGLSRKHQICMCVSSGFIRIKKPPEIDDDDDNDDENSYWNVCHLEMLDRKYVVRKWSNVCLLKTSYVFKRSKWWDTMPSIH